MPELLRDPGAASSRPAQAEDEKELLERSDAGNFVASGKGLHRGTAQELRPAQPVVSTFGQLEIGMRSFCAAVAGGEHIGELAPDLELFGSVVWKKLDGLAKELRSSIERQHPSSCRASLRGTFSSGGATPCTQQMLEQQIVFVGCHRLDGVGKLAVTLGSP